MLKSILSLAFLPLLVRADCDEWSVIEAAARLQQTQSYGDITGFKQLWNNLTYTENGKITDVATGILTKKLKIDNGRTFRDLTQCATYTEMIVADANNPYIIGTQMKISTKNGGVDRINSVVTKPGDWLFNATNYLYWSQRENWTTVATAKRDTRATIQKAADAYLDAFKDAKVSIPWGTPCARLEGGAYTGHGLANDTCNVGVPSGVTMKNRQYVIDEAYGSVDVMLNMGTHEWPDSHHFRVEGGKIRYVHTMTACGLPNCGLPT
ncbi:hypothetical protein GQ43DRAFT_423537 [Delitschia confertaspora ATCC 74209]|uniref:DUF8021 domain-containing protein n=1 Tax=Delitschia confertaspora ATCC 74209 TaxID=1513339 RepID=A0A9P4JH88_9PLEO|nr:hypothetical protein GQ43DRAFT_423537 [Delitschia confertaspora ATCC 74209]